MILNKWNPDKHIYEHFYSPSKRTILVTADMDQKIDCANCWKEISFWESYTSRLIHTDMWFWYPVCNNCYWQERKILSNNL